MKTKQEIEELKNNWLEDPCYDLEQTEGFKGQEKDLLIFRLKNELKWAQELNEKYYNVKSNFLRFLGLEDIKDRVSMLEQEK